MEPLRDLVAHRARLRRDLGWRRMRLHALEQDFQPLHQIRGLRARLVTKLLRRIVQEVLLLGELVLRNHLTRRTDCLRVIA